MTPPSSRRSSPAEGAPPPAPLAPAERARLVEAVQTNCHIADARSAADLSLCIYLLQMREFYRWEHGIAPLAPLPREAVGTWLAEREALWEALEPRDFVAVPVAGREFDPFDAPAIAAQLRPHGLVYGAGEVAPGRASFFVAELEGVEQRDAVELWTCGAELARAVAAPPAALQGATILLRRQSLRRWWCERYEAWTLKRQTGAFKAALAAHGFDESAAAAELQRIADLDAETLVLHELGEFEAGRRLDPDWQAMRTALGSRRADVFVRAARDHCADCLVTLPALLARGDGAALHAWFANLEGVRELLFPRLWPAYAAWCEGDAGAALGSVVARGAAHWQHVCERVLALHRERGAEAPAAIERWLVSGECALG